MVFISATMYFYPPLDRGTMGGLYLLLLLTGATCLGNGASNKILSRRFLAIVLPWLLAVLLYANGALDHSEEMRYTTSVVNTKYGWRSGTHDILTVRSWRPGRTNETFPIIAYQRFFYPGDSITVGIKPGALGVPWISSITR